MIERPTARYGRQRLTRRQRRLIAGVLTVLVLVAGVTVAIVAFGRFGKPVEGELSSYRLLDDETVEVTVSVTRENPAEPVVCIVRARSIDGGETGRREVLVAPSTQSTVQVTTVVKSNRPPVVGDVYGCGTDVPSYLVAP
jgi:hypothetical protein